MRPPMTPLWGESENLHSSAVACVQAGLVVA